MPAPAEMTRRSALAALTAFAMTGCSRALFLAANVPAAFGQYRRHPDIAYGPEAHQRLDVYEPDAPAPSAGRSLIVFWYGGRWTTGAKSDYRFVGAALAALGYVAVLPDYRHYPEVKIEGFMEDAARAALWAVDQSASFGANRGRFYTMGHSAGAHIAALLTLDPRYFARIGRGSPAIAGMIGLSGPYDFLPLDDADLQDMFGPPERYPDSQPIHFAANAAHGPPMLLIHGLDDRAVWPKNSINLAAALRGAGDTVTLKLYPKLKHADTVAALSILGRRRAPTLADVAEFIGRTQSS